MVYFELGSSRSLALVLVCLWFWGSVIYTPPCFTSQLNNFHLGKFYGSESWVTNQLYVIFPSANRSLTAAQTKSAGTSSGSR